MTSKKRKDRLLKALKNKEYRDAFVAEHINNAIPFQLRALRKKRNWSQSQLGEKLSKAQEWISKIEDPNYARFSLATLKELASFFDVGLIVRFAPYSEVVDWELNLTPKSIEIRDYTEESTAKPEMSKIEGVDQVALAGESENKPSWHYWANLVGELKTVPEIDETHKKESADITRHELAMTA